MDRLERVDCTKCGRSVYAVPGYVDPLCTQCGREKYNVPAHAAGLPRSSVTLGPRTGRVHEDDRQCGPDYRGWFAFCRRCMKRWPADSADQVADIMRVHDHVVHNPHGWIARTKLRPTSLIQQKAAREPPGRGGREPPSRKTQESGSRSGGSRKHEPLSSYVARAMTDASCPSYVVPNAVTVAVHGPGPFRSRETHVSGTRIRSPIVNGSTPRHS